ncbi:hypothetical protein [Noviherbaspirillum saxi]|uniref:Uncharacterized protein n=1 Tax=Noviherbaspirillum saxi TaxID=2320863 RepID=A0A3A3FG85_9BURK|nr:hypothetical protein [Noviherbaspirillum saxi]RJF92107.1 hypothetical protein D3871_26030 [Noviherbaspirillum saxi]
MSSISPIVSRPPVLPVWSPTPVTLDRTRRVKAEINAALPPFWRQLNDRLAAAGSGQAKFRVLAQLAEQADDIPEPSPYLPEPTHLDLAEEELAAWTRNQSAKARGKLCQLILGGNIVPSWPLYALQYHGRFNPLWNAWMHAAAKRYVALLRTDGDVVLALKALSTQPASARRVLVARMTEHASTALDIPIPATDVLDKDQDNRDADTLAQNPVRIRFYPAVFAKGTINLIVTVFHEAIHAEQMGIMCRSREAQGMDLSHLSSDEKYRCEVLELSTAHLDAISGTRKNDYHYYLYRYATESEREAHGAELTVALLAAACPELSQCDPGPLAEIGSTLLPGNAKAAASSTEAQVCSFIDNRTGFNMKAILGLVEKPLSSAHRRWSSLHELMMREPLSRNVAAPRAFARLRFETAADQLASRVTHLRVAARRHPATVDMSAKPAGSMLRDDTCVTPLVDMVWNSLLRLQDLRDPSDQSGMLLQALISESPKLFYGPSSEARFLRQVIAGALDAKQPPLVQVVRRHLERQFTCKLRPNPSPMQFAETAAALQSVWYTYSSDLSRKIVFEVACDAMGFASPNEESADSKRHKRRQALRRAIARSPIAVRSPRTAKP